MSIFDMFLGWILIAGFLFAVLAWAIIYPSRRRMKKMVEESRERHAVFVRQIERDAQRVERAHQFYYLPITDEEIRELKEKIYDETQLKLTQRRWMEGDYDRP